MTDTKSGLRILVGITLVAGTVLVASCSGPDKVTRTTTTEQSTTTQPMAPMVPMAPTTSTTTTTSTQQSRP